MVEEQRNSKERHCAYLQSHLSQAQALKLMQILEISKRRYNESMSVGELCEVMALARPDLMRGRGWNILRWSLPGLLLGALPAAVATGGIAAFGAAEALGWPVPTWAPLAAVGGLGAGLLNAYATAGYPLHYLGVVPKRLTYGPSRRAITRDQARQYLGRDPRYWRERYSPGH